MNTFITILILLTIIIICYYINRYIVKSVNKAEYSWNEVRINLLMSIFIPASVGYWVLYLINIIPLLPEHPPKWL